MSNKSNGMFKLKKMAEGVGQKKRVFTIYEAIT